MPSRTLWLAVGVSLAVWLAGCGRWPTRSREPAAPVTTASPTQAPAHRAPVTPPAVEATLAPADTVASAPQTAPAASPAVQEVPFRVVGSPQLVAAGVMQVNDRFLTLEEVLRPLQKSLRELAGRTANEAEFHRQAADMVKQEIRTQVERTLLLAQAEARLTEDDTKAIEAEVDRRFRLAVVAHGGAEARLAENLRQNGQTVADFREDLRRSVLLQSYLRKLWEPQIATNRKMLWDYYQAHRDRFHQPEGLQMQLIRVPVEAAGGADAQAQARARADEAAAALAGSEDFAAVARRLGQGPFAAEGGVWHMLDRGSFKARAVEEAAAAQEVGAVSAVLEADGAFWIVKTLGRRPARQRSFEDAQDEIERQVRQEQDQRFTREYLEKLYAKATILAADRLEQLAMDKVAQVYREVRAAP